MPSPKPGFFSGTSAVLDAVRRAALGTSRILPNQKKPSNDKNFFQNYVDHLGYLALEIQKLSNAMPETFDERQFNQLCKEALGRLNMFDALRDGHDYCDEIVGATVMPLAALSYSLQFSAVAIWEGSISLLSRYGIMDKDGKDHAHIALEGLVCAALALAFAVASFIKSAISLVSRPLVTAVQGFKPQDVDRFYDKTSVTATVRAERADDIAASIVSMLGSGGPR